MRIVFFNISYMNYYKGKDNDIMIGSFRYVKENKDGGEKHNFNPWIVNGKEVCYGFVEPGFTRGGYENGKHRQMHIQRINDAGNPVESLDNVLIVWCSKLPNSQRTVIVGWYKNATVYRNVITLPYDKENDRGLPEFGYWHNAVADLILLDKNPLEDITNMKKIEGVMVRVKWISKSEIDNMLNILTESNEYEKGSLHNK